MRNLDILCNEKFNGDMKSTIDYVLNNITGEELQIYTKEFNTSEAVYASNVLYYMAVKEHGEEYMDNLIKENVDLNMLNLTKEEVVNAEKNPYKSELGKSILKLLISSSGIIALTFLMNNFDLGAAHSTLETLAIGGTSIYSTMMAMNVGVNLLKYVKFKKLKKQYKKEEEINQEKANEGKVL